VKRLGIFALALAVAVWIAPASLASEVDALLDLLVKKGVVTQEEANGLRQEIEAQRKAEAAKKKGAPVSTKVPVRISGYAQMRGTTAQDETDSFVVRRARLTVSGDVAPRWDYKFQAEFGNTARRVVESVDFANSRTRTTSVQRPLLLDAQANYALGKPGRLSIGQFKVPFSYENLVSSTDLDTINRAQVVERLVPGRDIGSQGRDIGLQLSGTRDRLDYALGMFNGAGIDTSDDNDQKDVAARLVFHPDPVLALGVSWYDGRSGLNRATRDRRGGEVVYRDGPWTLRGEYAAGKDGSTRKVGWYAHGGYRFDPKWEGIARFDGFDPDRDAAGDRTDVLTLGVNRFASEAVKLQLNYERKNEQGPEIHNNALLAQLQVKF